MWNIPTITPEWIAQFPTYEAGLNYVKREFQHYLTLAEYPIQKYDLYAIYTRIVDFWGIDIKIRAYILILRDFMI